jgi:FKBP-type peptidyl-prolyl cis-trans isomerase FklB
MLKRTGIPAILLAIITTSAYGHSWQEETPPAAEDSAPAAPVQEIEEKTLVQKASYLIGYDFAQSLKADSIDIDMEQLFKGIKDASSGAAPPMSDEEILAVQQSFQKAMLKKQQDAFAKAADTNQRAGTEFMAKNVLEEGVKELESGVQYSVITRGTGTESPRLTDRVKVHLKGSTLDGSVFESTFGSTPVVFSVGASPLRGVASALQSMKAGDKWKLFIPGDMAFGAGGNPPAVGPNQTLIYEIELVEIVK